MVNVSGLSSTRGVDSGAHCCCAQYFARSCSNMPRSACTTERHASGIVVVLSQTGATFSKQQGSWTRAPEFGGAVTRITILGTPVERQEFVERELAKIIADHSELLTRIHEVQDLQCAWLLFLYCGAARANFHIRTTTWQCFCNLLRIRPDAVAASAKAATSLPLVAGRFGLRSALRLREAAHWASWADAVKVVWARHPDIAETILQAVDARDEAPSVQAINRSLESLVAVDFAPPSKRCRW